jgi:gamma-glutamyltranspeptidase / glutathione hydrolase
MLVCLWLPVAAWSAAAPGQAAIASAHPLATRAGMEVLEAGGNAFDAAVAVSAALGVVEPFSSGLGGGGLWLLHFAEDGRQVMVDARETAPGAAHATMYLDEQGEPIPGLSLNGPLAAGIPGTPAALLHVSERYGRLPLGRGRLPRRSASHARATRCTSACGSACPSRPSSWVAGPAAPCSCLAARCRRWKPR